MKEWDISITYNLSRAIMVMRVENALVLNSNKLECLPLLLVNNCVLVTGPARLLPPTSDVQSSVMIEKWLCERYLQGKYWICQET